MAMLAMTAANPAIDADRMQWAKGEGQAFMRSSPVLSDGPIMLFEPQTANSVEQLGFALAVGLSTDWRLCADTSGQRLRLHAASAASGGRNASMANLRRFWAAAASVASAAIVRTFLFGN